MLRDAIVKHQMVGELALVDLNLQAAEAMAGVGRRMAQDLGVACTFHATTERRQVLPDADCVILSAAPEGRRRWQMDRALLVDAGMADQVRECGGLGRLSYALRTISLTLDICEDMAVLCQRARLLDVLAKMLQAHQDILPRFRCDPGVGTMSYDDVKIIRHCDAGIVWFHAPNPWGPESPLVRNAHSWGPNWSCVVFLDRDDDTFFNGKLANGLYSARFGRRTARLRERVADFIRYERDWGRQVIVAAEYSVDVVTYVGEALHSTPPPGRLRPYDPAIVVHSTTRERWVRIAAEGRLLAASSLRRAGQEVPAIGLETFGEPPEYGEFIHFSPLGNPNGEIVVLSHQRGTLVTDFEAAYVPGARIYLDARRMIGDGLAMRDGLHVLKVHLALELQPYLVDVITAQDLGDRGEHWTPRRFASSADAEFGKRHPARQVRDERAAELAESSDPSLK